MEITEIVLLAIGGIAFIVSFILPEKISAGKKANTQEKEAYAKEEIASMVEREMQGIKSHLDSVVEEAVGYAMEKTERSLERLSNEKIMAVNEYSDTVLQEIHRNHEEVMFLYDMLNDKHTNLKNTVSQVNKTVKAAEETTREAEAAVQSFQQLNVENIAADQGKVIEKEDEESSTHAIFQNWSVAASSIIQTNERADIKRNKNEDILELYRKGKSKIDIAKELGLGVGEVKLVIDLTESNKSAPLNSRKTK